MHQVRSESGSDHLERSKANMKYSIWKPLWGPLTDWPLAVCDATSVDSSDLIAADIVTRTGYTENNLVYFSPRHKWYYLSGHMPSELMIFRQADTRVASKIGMLVALFSPGLGMMMIADIMSHRRSSQRVSKPSFRFR